MKGKCFCLFVCLFVCFWLLLLLFCSFYDIFNEAVVRYGYYMLYYNAVHNRVTKIQKRHHLVSEHFFFFFFSFYFLCVHVCILHTSQRYCGKYSNLGSKMQFVETWY